MKGFKPGYVPLERALSKLGIASRTQARQWILEGKVQVNGLIKKDPLFGVIPEKARIEIEGQLRPAVEFRAFIFHKPRGVVTTRVDEKDRPTVFDSFAHLGIHLVAVGRLDWATSGLLLLTNHTRLAHWLTAPSTGIHRVYLVTLRGKLDEASRKKILCEGIQDRGETLSAEDILIRKSSEKETHLTVTLKEGKNREIRRIFSLLGHEVTRLKRVQYGPIELGKLAPGDFQEISPQELLNFFPNAPLDPPQEKST